MSGVVAFVRRCLASGMPLEMALQAAEQFEAAPPVPSKGALRQRKYKERHRASSVTPNDDNDANDAEVTQNDASRVRDITPRLVTTGNSSAAAERADDWPDVKPGEIARQLAKLAGPGLADPAKASGLTTTAGEIIRWRQMGCSWEQDVVPVVTGRTARPRANPIGSWTLLTNDVLAAKARRERPIETPEATGPPGGTITDRIAADSAASTRRALELLKANG